MAEATVPEEAELAPEFVTAYLAGGTDRDELFRRANSVPGGFDPGLAFVIFPQILAAVAVAGHATWNLLGGNASSVSTLVKNLGDLWDRRVRRGQSAPAPDYPELRMVIDTINRALLASGVAPTDSELLTFRIVRALISDGAGTRAFLQAVPPSAN
ncbi:hypothetical protein [Nocardia sp. NPDC050710]|uniref:hypothetical protein n=1 Tax=Nocardia sp. NPDC050710 TaxID=3157220 RepID=UPI0033E60E66